MLKHGMFGGLSLHKKVLEILRGGAILTDNKQAHEYFQTARYDGRDINNVPWTKQKEYNIGYHYNLSIEDCARGITNSET